MTSAAAAGTAQARRWPLLAQGVAGAAVAGVLAAAALPPPAVLVLAVLALQVLLVLGVLALTDAPADGGIFVLAGSTAVVADLVALLAGGGRVGGLAAVVALAFVAAMLHQLVRRDRARVTESLAVTALAVVLVVAAACLVALRQLPGGREAVLVALAAAAAALLAGRVGDLLAPRPQLARGSGRGWPGLVLGLGAAVAAAGLVAGRTGEVAGAEAAALAVVVAAAVSAADLAVDLTGAELRAGPADARRAAALAPVALLLPYAVLGPVALLAGRLALT